MTVASAASAILAVVFASAGTMKLRAPTQFRSVLRALVPKPVVGVLSRAIPLTELSLAAWLVSGIFPRAAGAATVVVLGAFTLILVRMWRSGISQDCGCFGEHSFAATPASGLVRNALLLALSATVLIENNRSGLWHTDSLSLAAHFCAMLSVPAGWALGTTLIFRRDLLLTRGLGT